MKRIHKYVLARVALFAALALSGCVSITPIDLTGTWVGTLEWVNGPAATIQQPLSMEILHEDYDLSGYVRLMGPGSQTFDLPITQSDTGGRSIQLTASGTLTLITPPLPISIRLEGDFSEMSMSGSGSQTADGQTYSFTWELTRTTPIPES